MQIIDPKVREDLKASRPLRLNLGCGDKSAAGAYGVDLIPLPGVAIQADLNEPLSEFPDNSVASIVSYHVFEHIGNFAGLMRELHRVVRPEGTIEFVVPHFSCSYYYSDPTHVRFFGLYTMSYFSVDGKPFRRKVPTFYTDCRFKILRVNFTYSQGRIIPFAAKFQHWLFNLSPKTQAVYERCLCWILPAYEIRFLIQPVKTAQP